MPPKRKNDDPGDLTARERKKLKMADARTISVQPTPSANGATPASEQRSGNGDTVASSSAGPSKTVVRFDSMEGLPASIDVERFTEARAYEIDAMQKAIKAAGESSTHRAWQTLPRHLRRRAASHDIRRVPLRLRAKARAEMDSAKRKVLGRPKRGKANQITRTEALLKRQRDKSWLETHIWHAKRAKMENMWGYRLAVTPTEKAFRPSHRASMHGSILHDASYYATIELKGPQILLQSALEQCCDPQTSGMKRCMTGSRACETHVYKHARFPLDLLGPVTIIWQPLSAVDTPSPPSEPPAPSGKANGKGNGNGRGNGKGKGKGKAKEKQTEDRAPSQPNEPRVIWVRCHPAIFEDVFETLRTSASHVLNESKKNDPGVHAAIEIADLRGCINAFEIMGPKSSQVIKGVFSPVGNDDRKEFKKFWDSLTDLQTSASVPRGTVIGLKVLDPRLKFPPKNAKPHYPEITKPSNQQSPAFIFPTALMAQSDIWDEKTRGSLKKPKYKKKDLDERRSKNLVPGTPLNPLRQDDRIPLLLIQRSVEPSASSTSSSPSDNTQGIHGWTLLFPAGWSMAFLTSLIYTGTRFAGQRERTKQFFEAGMNAFPQDYPTVDAYDVVVDERVEKERARWERTPAAKRANFGKLGTRSPWRADWGVVLGLEKPAPASAPGAGVGVTTRTGTQGGEGEGLVTTQRENPPDPDAMQVDADDSTASVIKPWLLRGAKVPNLLSNAFITPGQFLEEINKLRSRHHMSPFRSSVTTGVTTPVTAEVSVGVSPEGLMKSALVMVRTKMVRRGAPGDMANIYRMEDVEARKWIKVMSKGGATDEAGEIELGEIKPNQTDIIGYVTTGDISLVRGEGFAVGAIPVVQYLALRKQALRLSQTSVMVKIRDRDGMVCRAAFLELLDG